VRSEGLCLLGLRFTEEKMARADRFTALELVGVPALLAWQTHVARRAGHR
jgi:hypothetical protein